MKKIFIYIIASIVTTNLFAYDCEIDGIYYNLDKENKTASVTFWAGKNEPHRYSGQVTIPSTITHEGIIYGVTEIDWEAFSYCTNLTSVTLPDHLTVIGTGAFMDCWGLSSITIPKEVKEIKENAFANCLHLKEVYVLSKIVQIGDGSKRYEYVFDGCRINDFYCAESVDLTFAGGVIINVHHLSDKELDYKNSFLEYAQEYVEKRINKWQIKGEYEKTEDWKLRVNETSRKQKANEYLMMAKKKYLTEYAQKQFYSFTLGSYDPDNEVYLFKEARIGDILVPVAISDAKFVKENWEPKEFTPHYDIVGNEVLITSIDFTFSNNKTYTYKSNQNLTFAQTNIEYNFNPINLQEGDNTPTYASQKNQQVIQQNIIAGQSDVDINIPATTKHNDSTFVVIIANENYQSVAAVPFAKKDGKIMAQYCNKTMGIPSEHIRVYEDATYNNMRLALSWLDKVCRSYEGTASVIFYYTGHGMPDEDDHSSYLLPVDGDSHYAQSGVALDELYSKLGNMPSRSITVLLDACFSGASRNGAMLASAKSVAITAKKGTPRGNTVVLAAAQGNETAGFYEEKGHGLFTYFVLKKLQETKGDVTLEELGSYVTKEVNRRSSVQNKTQTPCITPASAVVNVWKNWKL